MAEKVEFQLKPDVNRVEINVQESDETIVITDNAERPYTATAGSPEFRALENHPGVKRVDGKRPQRDKSQEQPA